MPNDLIKIIRIIAWCLPLVFVISVIGWIIYRISKARDDLSIGEKIFSWIFFVFYVLVFCSALFFRDVKIGEITWGLVGFIVLALSIALLFLIHFVVNTIKKHQLKHRETKIVQAKLVGAVEKSSSSVIVPGREPRINNFYALVFEYEENGKKKSCKTNKLYRLPQIAYIKKQSETTTISVYKNVCEIEMDTITVSTDYNYDLEDLKDLKISSIESIGSAQYYLEIFAILAFSIPALIEILVYLVQWKAFNLNSILFLIAGINLVIFVVKVILMCYRKIKALKYGLETFALEFNVGSVKRCYIKYTFETARGIKMRKERVTIDAYGKIKILNKLPIKVYKNWAVIDLDKLP